MGIKEQLIFPEIEYDKIDKIRGMDIIFVTTAETDEEAKEIAWDYVKATMDRVMKERGGLPMQRERFEYEVKYGAYYVGSPETVAQKIARMIQALGVQRFNLVYSVGGQLQKHRFQTVRLYGEKVIPRVKELLG